jgi:hypothetical protein
MKNMFININTCDFNPINEILNFLASIMVILLQFWNVVPKY